MAAPPPPPPANIPTLPADLFRSAEDIDLPPTRQMADIGGSQQAPVRAAANDTSPRLPVMAPQPPMNLDFETQPPVIPPQMPRDEEPPRSRSGSRSHSRSRSAADDEISRSRSPSSDRSSAEDEEDRDYSRWRHIEEDRTEPCQDELDFIESRPEYSALDHEHWQKEAFFALDDPAFTTRGEGRIDWVIHRFNGTKEEPNKDSILRSQVVNIGGFDWQIKFFPKGNSTEFLSLYIDNLTLASPEWEEFEEFNSPPFPFLKGADNTWIKKRRSIAAQVAINMYNPAEPRTNEFRSDATRFTKKSADYGWKYFSHRDDFHLRRHGQRQAMLRDDKLALTAYIRVVDDPTSCLWDPENGDRFESSILNTSLRPFVGRSSFQMTIVPLLHFTPFRDLIKRMTARDQGGRMLQQHLYKMYTRLVSRSHRRRGLNSDEPSDGAQILYHVSKILQRDIEIAEAARELLGVININSAAVHSNRLQTKTCASVQEAIDKLEKPIATPVLLTLELQRHEFDRAQRRWNKLTNKVHISDEIVVSGLRYHLFAVVTHCGHLRSNRHNCAVRVNDLWYSYDSDTVVAMTRRQAIDAFEGNRVAGGKDIAERRDSPISIMSDNDSDEEVIYLTMYVRGDHLPLATPRSEWWNVPEWLRPESQPGLVSEPHLIEASANEDVSAGAMEVSGELPSAPPLGSNREPTSPRTEPRSLVVGQAPFHDGAATPEHIHTDGEGDVVMSDAEDVRAADEVPRNCTVDALGRDYYSGGYLNSGKYHGHGHLIAINGDEYMGDFVHGQKTGTGKMTYANGNTYEGQWLDNKHHGQGKYIVASTKTVYEGGWKHGQKHGDFVLRGTVTEDDRAYCTICFTEEINTAFMDCGHVLTCRKCASRVDDCPVCRKRVHGRLQLFGVKMSME
ncbi:Translation initiation factor IF-2, N-terminal region [Teratosphaeria destructans]|uniref:Translation initiation factor IF-2, N-terminal region n=1 Tax=Teratosphaeria destructans TaxID=418781 RepID=A0A9W7SJD8_9PEZI|nr:Translation initiation factor IF-2, N-terminal region [Teratosphaeria destructans]